MVLEPRGRSVGLSGYARYRVNEAEFFLQIKVVPRQFLSPLGFAKGDFSILRRFFYV